MKFKHTLGASLVAATLALCWGTAQAGTVADQLFAGQQLLSDSSAEVLINGDTTTGTTVDIGDQLVGIFTIEKLQQGTAVRPLGLGSTNNEMTGIFDVVVTGKTGGPGSWRFTFGAVSSATFLANTGVAGTPAGTTIAVFDDPAQNFNRGGSTALGNASATGGSLFWLFGFNPANSGDGWFANTLSDDIAAIANLPPGAAGGRFNLGQDQLAGGIGPKLLSTACTDGAGAITTVNICGNGSLTAITPGSGYDSFDQTQLAVNAQPSVPEPSSIALLAVGAFGVGAVALRRAKKAD
jgi:hypothetical protein